MKRQEIVLRIISLHSLCVFVLILHLSQDCLRAQDLTFDLASAKDAWRTYFENVGSVEGTVKSSIKIKGKKFGSNSSDIVYGRDRRHQKTVVTASKGNLTPTSADAFVRNPKYVFEVGKAVESGGWGLTGMAFVASGNDEETKAYVQSFDRRFMHLEQLFTLAKTTLVNLVDQPNFRIVKSGEVERKGKKLVQIEFTNIHPLEAEETKVQKGTLVLDPKAFWCIESGEVELLSIEGTLVVNISNEYELEQDGVPLPIRTIHRYKTIAGESKGNESEIEIETKLQRLKVPVKDSEFTLSAFGLPEPKSNFRFPVSLSVALGIFGLAVFTMGLYIRRQRQIGSA